jgi:Zn finger protein HypA/HybF involved in hydrogenase expression
MPSTLPALTDTNSTICSENLLSGAAIMAVAPPPGVFEPTHGCRDCDAPLWQLDDTPYAACPFCGEEAERITYCRTCDGPNCRNTGH